jgi:hypothetical protein
MVPLEIPDQTKPNNPNNLTRFGLSKVSLHYSLGSQWLVPLVIDHRWGGIGVRVSTSEPFLPLSFRDNENGGLSGHRLSTGCPKKPTPLGHLSDPIKSRDLVVLDCGKLLLDCVKPRDMIPGT